MNQAQALMTVRAAQYHLRENKDFNEVMNPADWWAIFVLIDAERGLRKQLTKVPSPVVE